MPEKEETKTTNPLVELIQLLQSVETDTPEAKLNETTMSDKKGGRIKY